MSRPMARNQSSVHAMTGSSLGRHDTSPRDSSRQRGQGWEFEVRSMLTSERFLPSVFRGQKQWLQPNILKDC